MHQEKIVEKQYNTFSTHADLDKSFDILISIGGDGTILRAATFVRDSGIPILGVNAGRLGFLAKVQKENIESFLQIVLEKKYSISKVVHKECYLCDDLKPLKINEFKGFPVFSLKSSNP